MEIKRITKANGRLMIATTSHSQLSTMWNYKYFPEMLKREFVRTPDLEEVISLWIIFLITILNFILKNMVRIEEVLGEAKRGRILIVVDDEHRENEGDFFVATEKLTPQTVNFMAQLGRGLICISLPINRLEKLRIPPIGVLERPGHTEAATDLASLAGLKPLGVIKKK